MAALARVERAKTLQAEIAAQQQEIDDQRRLEALNLGIDPD